MCFLNMKIIFIILFFIGIFLLVGILIYVVKLNVNVWYWNMVIVFLFFVMFNSFVICIFYREYCGFCKEVLNIN